VSSPPAARSAGPAGLVAVAAPHQRTSASRPLPVAADTRRLQKVSAAVISGPDTDQPSGHRPRFWKQQRTSTASAVSGSPTPWTRRCRLGGRLRQDGGGPTAAVPAPWQRRPRCACLSVLVTQARSTQPASSGCPDPPTPDAACRTAGARTPRHCGHPRLPPGHACTAAAATLDGQQQHRAPPQPARRPPPEPRPGTARSSAPTSSAASRRGFSKFARPPATYPCRLRQQAP
jgi:hypothetical protein